MKTASRRSIGGDVWRSAGSRVVAYGLSLVSAVLVARALGATGKGTLSLGTAIPGIVSLIGGLGMGTAVTIGMREGWIPVRWALRMLGSYALAVGLLAVIVTGLIPNWFGTGYGPAYALASSASIGGLLLADFSGGLLQGTGRVATGMWVRQAVGIGQTALVILLIVAGTTDPLVLLATMAGWAWVCGITGYAASSRIKAEPTPPDGKWVVRLLLIGVKTQLIWVLLLLHYRLDLLLVGALGSVRDVGVYSVAVSFSEVAWFGANAFAAVLLPHVTGLEPQAASATAARAARLSILTTLLLAASVALILSMFAISVFGNDFAQTPAAFLALTPGLISFSAFKIVAIFAIGVGRIGPVAIFAALGLVVNLCANFILIPPFGGVGAGIASSISYSLISILLLIWFIRDANLPLRAMLVVTRSDISAALPFSRAIVIRDAK